MAKTNPSDPAYWMLQSSKIYSQPKVFLASCYICADSEYMRMGLPLCRECCVCRKNKVNQTVKLVVNPKNPQEVEPGYGHVAADDSICYYCKHICDPSNPDCIYYEKPDEK